MTDVPDWLQSGSLRLVEQAVNRGLALDPDSPSRLAALSGRSLRVHLTETPVAVLCTFNDTGLELAAATPETAADAAVHTSLAGLLTLVSSGGERSRDTSLTGDVGVIQAVKRLFGEVELDWEDALSRVTGDLIAHRVGETARGGRDWSRHAGDTFLRNLGEYLTEERRLIPTEAELAGFVADVRATRADADRLEARLRRLERGSGG